MAKERGGGVYVLNPLKQQHDAKFLFPSIQDFATQSNEVKIILP